MSQRAHDHDYVFDWNHLKKVAPLSSKPFEILDETLRDGIQSPSVTDPGIEEKIELLHLMESLGIGAADLGLPGAGERQQGDVEVLVKEIESAGLKIKPNCAARTMVPAPGAAMGASLKDLKHATMVTRFKPTPV